MPNSDAPLLTVYSPARTHFGICYENNEPLFGLFKGASLFIIIRIEKNSSTAWNTGKEQKKTILNTVDLISVFRFVRVIYFFSLSMRSFRRHLRVFDVTKVSLTSPKCLMSRAEH